MAKLYFNKDNQVENFTFIIARKDFYKFGAVVGFNVNYRTDFNGPDEISLSVYKSDVAEDVWNHINDYNVLIVPELGDDGYFEMQVDLNEDNQGVYKNITATALAESELSHVNIYNYEINSENEQEYDDEWSKENVTIFYYNDTDIYPEHKHRSLLHRILDKIPNYSIEHVDATLLEMTEWYSFSWDDQDIYSILTGDVAEQYHVYFKFNSRKRTISAYDLYSVCQNDNCDYRVKMLADRGITTRYRGDFQKVCPKCGSTNITPGYGKFTKIIVAKENLMNTATVRSNKDSLYNCFKIKSGDEDMDADVINQNPNGSDYIYQFSKEQLAEMPVALVNKIRAYNAEYDKYYNGEPSTGKGIYTFTTDEITDYNKIISFIAGKFEEDVIGQYKNLQPTYTGFQSLASLFYTMTDLQGFIEYSMTPGVIPNHDTLADTIILVQQNASPVAVIDPSSASDGTVESAIVQGLNCVVNTALYVLTAKTTTWSPPASKTGTGAWKGTVTIEEIEYRDAKTAEERQAHTAVVNLTVSVNADVTLYAKQKVDYLIARRDAQVKPLTDMTPFAKGTDTKADQDAFKEQLGYYSYDILKTIVEPSFQDCLSILTTDMIKPDDLYAEMYRVRIGLIQDAIKEREEFLKTLSHFLKNDAANKDYGVVTKYRMDTHDQLNFPNYLGEDLWKVFCSYRREYTYSNDNYIATDLTNAERIERAGQLVEEAQKELYKASNLQFEVTGDLNNLLSLPAFKPILNDFEVGNWIHLQVDEDIYNLRLLSYQINFDNIQSITVDFSTVEKIWTGASDIQSVLDQAGSMAGSYGYTQQQVKDHSKSNKIVKDWVDLGLEATKTRFVDDSAVQEIVYDSSGLWARTYDEITSTYLPQQLKINKNGLYMTNDSWKHITSGTGAISYYDPDKKKYVDTYGIIAQTVVGKLFLGENLKIYSNDGNSTAQMTMDGNGLTVTNGTASVKINPNNSNIFQILNGNTPTLYANSSGNVTMTGTITAKSGYIGNWKIGQYAIHRDDVIKDGITYRPILNAPDADDLIPDKNSAFCIEITDASGNKMYPFAVYYSGRIKATNADITGTINSGDGHIGGWNIESAAIYREVTATDGTKYRPQLFAPVSPELNNGAFSIKKTEKNGTISYPFAIYYDGSIKATTGTLGPWTLTERYLYATRTVSGVSRTTGLQVPDQGVYALAIGATDFGNWKTAPFRVTHDGEVTLGSALNLTGSGTTPTWINFYKGTSLDASIGSPGYPNEGLSIASSKGVYIQGYDYSIDISYTSTDTTNNGGSEIKLTDGFVTVTGVLLTSSRITALGGIGTNGRSSYNDAQNGMWATTGGSISLRHNGSSGAGIIGWFYAGESSWSSQIKQTASGVLEAVGYFKMRTTGGNADTRRVAIGTATDAPASAGQHISHMWCGSAQVYINAEWGGTYDTRSISVPSSDIRLKKNVKDSAVNALNVLNKIRMREFDWKDSGKHQSIGMVADEIEKIDPRLSVGGGTDEDGNVCYKSVDDFYLDGYLVKGVQELYQKIKDLENKIKRLKSAQN